MYEYASLNFYHFFTKGNNFCDFLGAFLDNAALFQNNVLSQKKQLAPRVATGFLLYPILNRRGGKIKTYPLTLKCGQKTPKQDCVDAQTSSGFHRLHV